MKEIARNVDNINLQTVVSLSEDGKILQVTILNDLVAPGKKTEFSEKFYRLIE